MLGIPDKVRYDQKIRREVHFFNQTLVQVDSFVLRNRQLLIAAKRQAVKKPSTYL
jgi:hypothetical protein